MAAVTLICIAGLAACSSSPSSGAPKSSNTAAAESSGGASAAGVQAATAYIRQYLSAPTSISLTVPLKAKPPTGKTVYWVEDDNSDDIPTTDGIEAAAKALGWNVRVIQYDPTVAGQVTSTLQQAVDANADYIATVGQPLSIIAGAVHSAAAKHIPVFDSYSPNVPAGSTNDIYTEVAGLAQYNLIGTILGNYNASISQGKANEVFVNIPAYPALTVMADADQKAIEQRCPTTCQFNTLNLSLTELASTASTIVGYLRAHPSTTYVQLSAGFEDTGLIAAIKSAGLSGITIDGAIPNAANLQAVKAGTEKAWVLLPHAISGWWLIDAMARFSEGMSEQPNITSLLPTQIISADNLPNPLPSDVDVPTNYPAQFMSLWHVG
jgi:Periplasmic binding protein domain